MISDQNHPSPLGEGTGVGAVRQGEDWDSFTVPTPTPPLKGRGFKHDFPGLASQNGKGAWHYLDTGATAQKPQAVIDAVRQAMGADYATVHRGVYQRSADMTLAFEKARERVAIFIGADSPNEIVFTKGATEAINLVAHSWGASMQSGDRILLSTLEHHSNIVPWQLLRDRLAREGTHIHIDVCPLSADGQIDLDAAEEMLTPQHKLLALAHVSNVLGGTLDTQRAARLAHKVGAMLLLDACQSVPHMPVDVQALDCDFLVFSGHKLYGPTGVGVLWARAAILAAMPPYQGGGAMIDRVTFEKTTYAPPPGRFEAGTPMITEVIGLHAAIDYVAAIGMDAILAHEAALVKQTRDALRQLNSITLFGPEKSAGIVSFTMQGVHPHDIGTILDEEGVAVRAGHHCCQPLMAYLGVGATARASFGLYNDEDDVAALLRGLERVKKVFG